MSTGDSRVQCWQPPSFGWYKLNTDDSCLTDSGVTSYGGVLRSADGDWFCGFNRFVGCCSIIEAELWGVLEGLSLAWSRDLKNIFLEVDSLDVFHIVF
ncbi:hypothetical protein GQ457_18G004090 [Hibiscus cannabinus]